MPLPPSRETVAERNGRWGEDVAVEHLRANGYVIVDRNARPCRRDRRLEIDIVAYDRENDVMVFVEVKQHRSHSQRERRLRSVDRRKLRLMRRVCSAWLKANRWTGARRFDVVEVLPWEIRHIPGAFDATDAHYLAALLAPLGEAAKP